MSEVRRFRWDAAAESLSEALAHWDGPVPCVPAKGRHFEAENEGRRLEVRVPLVLARPSAGEELQAWLARTDEPPGLQLLVLIQAGAAALGLYEAGELAEHRTFKRYVVRGNGRAQPSYLATKGKSRYGSRLRLRNAQRLLEETAETLRDWRTEHGAFQAIFHSCPLRIWAELLREDLPFDADGPLVKIPMDLRRPSHAEMLRTWRALSHGSWLISA